MNNDEDFSFGDELHFNDHHHQCRDGGFLLVCLKCGSKRYVCVTCLETGVDPCPCRGRKKNF